MTDSVGHKIARRLEIELGWHPQSAHRQRAAAIIDAELARERDAVDALIQAALQYIDDTAGEQEDEEEIAKSLGRYAPLSLRNLRECAARLRKLIG